MSPTPLSIAAKAKDELELHYFRVEDLRKHFLIGNSKTHDCPKVWESIMRYGFSDPVKLDPALNDGKGGVVEGNGRLEAVLWALDKKYEPARGIKLDSDGGWALPVLVGVNQPTEVMAQLYSVDHNISNTWGSGLEPLDVAKLFDWDALNAQLDGFADENMELLSWGDAELQELKGEYDPEESPTKSAEDLEELEKQLDDDNIKLRAKKGEIWQLGTHFICCGDSTDEASVRLLMNKAKVNKFTLVHADPPYGMGKENDGVLNDNLYKTKLDAFQMSWWKAILPHIVKNGSAYVWGTSEDLWRLWFRGGLQESTKVTFRNEITWDKGSGQGMDSSQHRMFPTATERCLFFMLGQQGFNTNADNYWEEWEPIRAYLEEQQELMEWSRQEINSILGSTKNGGGMASHFFSRSQFILPTPEMYQKLQKAAKGKAFQREYDDLKKEYDDLKKEWMDQRCFFDNTHDSMTDAWKFPRVFGAERWGHATPKPVEMIERVYKSSSKTNDPIYSPFLGSGTDLIAAEQTNRRCLGFELSENYVSVVINRWEKLTSKTAKKVGNL